jgi:hypothetical protein
MDSTRALKRLLFLAIVVVGSALTLGILATPTDPTGEPATRPAPVAGYTHDELQRGADMTDQMSAASANTGSPAHTQDEQLRRSQHDPGYVEALEEHQAGLDQMLARRTP